MSSLAARAHMLATTTRTQSIRLDRFGARTPARPFSRTLARDARTSATAAMSDFYALSSKTAKGDELDFATLKGKPVLIVNVASKCGFTPQYKGLQALYEKYGPRGLVVLGFPTNEFGAQEPGSEEQIVSFCSLNYGVTFPIMQKTEVNTADAHPVYKFLKSEKKSMMMEMIKWNFEKFLVSPEGEVVARYTSMATPESLESAIEKLLPK